MEEDKRIGVWETEYGNACIVDEETLLDEEAHDIDMNDRIPLEMVDFTKLISKDIHKYY